VCIWRGDTHGVRFEKSVRTSHLISGGGGRGGSPGGAGCSVLSLHAATQSVSRAAASNIKMNFMHFVFISMMPLALMMRFYYTVL